MEEGDLEKYLSNVQMDEHMESILRELGPKLGGAFVVATRGEEILGFGGLYGFEGRNYAHIQVAEDMRECVVFLYRALKSALEELRKEYAPIYAEVSIKDGGTNRLVEMLGFDWVGPSNGGKANMWEFG